jgi:hypothetical protein
LSTSHRPYRRRQRLVVVVAVVIAVVTKDSFPMRRLKEWKRN